MYRVIIVEDEATVRKGIVSSTNWSDLECVVIGEAANGEEGMDLVLRLSPDIIITDVKMPRMDGVLMIQKLRDAGCSSQFIILTAYGDFRYARSALRLGVRDYLLKPLKDDELETAVRSVLQTLGEQERTSPDQDRTAIIPCLSSLQPQNRYVSDALQFIHLHYNRDITISTVAGHLDISEGYLSRIFRKETSCTFTNYLTYYRIRQAMSLLKNYRIKVYQVADQVGYSDTTYFSAQFKKIVGISPSEYQERCR